MRTQTSASDSLNAKLLLKTLVAFKKGDFSARLPGEWTGEAGKIADTLNDIIELSDRTSKELERVSRRRDLPDERHRGPDHGPRTAPLANPHQYPDAPRRHRGPGAGRRAMEEASGGATAHSVARTGVGAGPTG